MYDIIVFSSFYKPHLGGVEKYVENFYKRIPSKKILIVTSKHDKNLTTREKDQELEIFRIDSVEIIKGKYFIPSINGFKQIKKILKENQKDNLEVHTHTRFYLTNFIATFLSNRYHYTHYHFEHGSSFVKDGSSFVKTFAYLFDQSLGKYILKKSSKIFPISEGVKNFLEENYKNLNYGPILYNSYNFKEEDFLTKKIPTILKLLFVGRIIKTKGVYELIGACLELQKQRIPFILTMIGDGSERKKIEEKVKEYNLEKQILIRGSLPYEETQKEYPKHDIFLNPSYTEGLPTTVLEALSNSLLVVASNAGGTNEIIPNEYLLETNNINPSSIAEKIIDLKDNWSSYQRIYQSIYGIAKGKFNWKTNVTKYRDIRIT